MKIVVVDDCTEMRRLIRSVLPVATEIVECSDCRSAVQALRDHEPHCVLLDIAMRPIDGIETAHRLLEIAPHVRIIFVTAYDEPRWRAAASDLCVSGYVLKDSLDQINEIIKSFGPSTT